MRAWFEKSAVELFVLAVVLAYGLFVFVDLGVGELAADWWRETGAKAFDGGFLAFFVAELVLKVFAFGPSYFSSVLNVIDALAIVLCATLFVLVDILGLFGGDADESAAADGEDGEGGAAESLGSLLVLLRFVRVFRLAAVMLRSLHASQSVGTHENDSPSGSDGSARSGAHSFDCGEGSPGSGAADDVRREVHWRTGRHKPPPIGYRGSRGAAAWAFKRRKRAELGAAADVVPLGAEARAFLDRAPRGVVELLTVNVTTLLRTFRELDHDGDGMLRAAELMPGLRKLRVDAVTAKELFSALDRDGDGTLDVAELFRAGAYLRAHAPAAAIAAAADPAAAATAEAGGALGASGRASGASVGGASKGSVADGAADGAARRGSGAESLWQRSSHGLQERFEEGYRWWTRARWAAPELSAQVTAPERPPAPAGKEVVVRLDPPYEFEAGRVSLSEHCNGSGAMLEGRVEQMLRLIDLTLYDLTALSQKLLEVETGQPREVAKRRDELATYRTYLQGLARALPSARLRLEPFANDQPGHSGWQAMRPPRGVEVRVARGALCISLGLGAGLAVRIALLLAIGLRWGHAESAYERRLACERLFALNTTTEDIPDVFSKEQEAAYFGAAAGDEAYLDLFPSSGCDEHDGRLQPFFATPVAPVLSVLTVLLFGSLLFRGNANPTAMKQLLTDPRVTIIMLQSITRAGLVTTSMTQFPVALRFFGMRGPGTSLFAAKLLDCLFLPCAIVVFVMMDCLIIAAPRMRCMLALNLLFLMTESLALSQFSSLPSIHELRADDQGAAIISSLETGLLAMMLGAIISSIWAPRELTFVKLPTGLMDLVLFEAGAQQLQKKVQDQRRANFKAAHSEQRALHKCLGEDEPHMLHHHHHLNINNAVAQALCRAHGAPAAAEKAYDENETRV